MLVNPFRMREKLSAALTVWEKMARHLTVVPLRTEQLSTSWPMVLSTSRPVKEPKVVPAAG